MEKYYQKETECAPRGKLRELQSERLVSQVRYVWEHVPYYREKMEQAGVSPADIRGIEDIGKLPFLSKDDLRKSYPDGLRGVPAKDCVRIHSTSGTTGKRVVAYYTREDIDLWDDCVARALVAADISEEDIVQVCYGYGLFTGGLGLHGGAEKLGCMVLPMSSGNTERQLQFMQDLGSTVLCCTPSYAAYLAEVINATGVRNSIRLRRGIFGAEAWSEDMRHSIERDLGIKAMDIYGLTELSGPGVAYECSAQSGMHINEDHFYAETIDPDTGEILPNGSKGELVITSLTKKGFPLLRYRTRDICILSEEKCSCGRTFIKMSRPMGRSDDMLIVKGVNVFPSQIETVLIQQGYSSNYQIVVDRVSNSDTLDVMVEMTQENFSDSLGKITANEKSLVSELKTMLGIHANVHLVAPGTITRSEGKAVRVIDKRKI
ncbi:MAG: phenylacetate--CoA ligase [Spirochaetales bacterium]|nr:phenylacetate--CoA ligase [Spirochaetales bacterium]